MGASACAAQSAPAQLPEAQPRTQPRPPQTVPWPDATRLRDLVSVGEYVSSEHFGRPLRVTVKVTPRSTGPYGELVTQSALDTGTIVATEHHTPSGALWATLVMLKGADGWDFIQLDASSRRVKADAASCARCHAEGRADHLFGLPKPVHPPDSGLTTSPR
jgi:cytochrome c553